MWGLDHFNELRVLRIVDVRTEGYVIDRKFALNRGSFHRGDFVRLGHDVLKSPMGNNSHEKSSKTDGKDTRREGRFKLKTQDQTVRGKRVD